MKQQLISRLSRPTRPTQAQMGETVRRVDLLFGQLYAAPYQIGPILVVLIAALRK